MCVCMSVWQTERPVSGIHDKSIGKKRNPAQKEWRLTASQSPSYLVWSEWRIKKYIATVAAVAATVLQLYWSRRWVYHVHSPLGVYVVSTLLNKYTSSKNICIKNNFQLPENFDGLIWFYALFKWTWNISCFAFMSINWYSNTTLHFSNISKSVSS